MRAFQNLIFKFFFFNSFTWNHRKLVAMVNYGALVLRSFLYPTMIFTRGVRGSFATAWYRQIESLFHLPRVWTSKNIGKEKYIRSMRKSLLNQDLIFKPGTFLELHVSSWFLGYLPSSLMYQLWDQHVPIDPFKPWFPFYRNISSTYLLHWHLCEYSKRIISRPAQDSVGVRWN